MGKNPSIFAIQIWQSPIKIAGYHCCGASGSDQILTLSLHGIPPTENMRQADTSGRNWAAANKRINPHEV